MEFCKLFRPFCRCSAGGATHVKCKCPNAGRPWRPLSPAISGRSSLFGVSLYSPLCLWESVQPWVAVLQSPLFDDLPLPDDGLTVAHSRTTCHYQIDDNCALIPRAREGVSPAVSPPPVELMILSFDPKQEHQYFANNIQGSCPWVVMSMSAPLAARTEDDGRANEDGISCMRASTKCMRPRRVHRTTAPNLETRPGTKPTTRNR